MNVVFHKPEYIDEFKDDIYLFTQFYIPKEDKRIKEVNDTLKNNLGNTHIKKIVLLNERIYTPEELGLKSDKCNILDKIEQIVIKDRLTYNLFFKYASAFKGYLILANSDIYFDKTLKNIYKTPLSRTKSCYTQLRFESNKKLFGPRSDSQDTWLFHSNNFPESHMMYHFQLGQPGCDNKITFWLKQVGYTLYNEPFRIKTYHMHMSDIRHYSGKDVIPGPHVHIVPFLSERPFNNKVLNNKEFYNYLKKKIDKNISFYIPKVGLLEHKCVYKLLHSYKIQEDLPYLAKKSKIVFSNDTNFKLYITMYAECFFQNECMINYGCQNNNIKEISLTNNCISKEYLYCEDLINPSNSSNLVNTYFTHAFIKKNILIICDYTNNFKNKLEKNIFLDCTFIYLYFDINMNTDWFTNYMRLCKEVKSIENNFDIALCDCYGLSNLITNYIYTKLNKSAMSLQDSLKLYLKNVNNMKKLNYTK